MARPVPTDLEDALAESPEARERFWAMPPEQKDSWVGWVERPRLPVARRRRVREAVRRLAGPRAPRTTVATANGSAPAPLPREGWAVWLLGLVLLAGLAAFLVWYTVYRDDGKSSKPPAVVVSAKATVPKVVGVRYQAAEFQLKEAKLAATVVRRAAAKPKGIVVGQKPKPGATLPQGTPVTLVVSNGPPGVAMPDVVGLAAADAVRALQARKLSPTLKQVPSQEPPGTVVAQTPKAGARAKPGTKVVLEVSRAAPAQQTTTRQTTTQQVTTQQATTPTRGNDYTGMRLSAAVAKIAQGRQQVIVEYVASSKSAGVVVSSSKAGSRERLQVSAGPKPQALQDVPDVTGEDAATAEQDLRAAGFSVVTAQWPVSDQSLDGTVTYQTPSGVRIPQGATVVVYVGTANA